MTVLSQVSRVVHVTTSGNSIATVPLGGEPAAAPKAEK
jgi:hypothetical protein